VPSPTGAVRAARLSTSRRWTPLRRGSPERMPYLSFRCLQDPFRKERDNRGGGWERFKFSEDTKYNDVTAVRLDAHKGWLKWPVSPKG